MAELFSKRHNIQTPEREITIREDAPQGLREFILNVLDRVSTLTILEIRNVVCSVLNTAPDDNYVNERFVREEIKRLLSECRWYKIYDIIEAFARSLSSQQYIDFHSGINDYFIENGIGWKLENGLIEIRGDQAFENSLKTVGATLEERKLNTAKNEIKEAIKDLSRKPISDITGAVQHSLAALECVSREVTGDIRMTLGELIKNHPTIAPSLLNIVISKMWGYSSEQGRHLQEGREPSFEEAELLVHLSATLCTYLSKKHISIEPTVDESDNLPF